MHCGPLQKQWKEVAKICKNDDKIKVGKVNGESQRGLLQRLGVRAYPTIMLVKKAQAEEYNGKIF